MSIGVRKIVRKINHYQHAKGRHKEVEANVPGL